MKRFCIDFLACVNQACIKVLRKKQPNTKYVGFSVNEKQFGIDIAYRSIEDFLLVIEVSFQEIFDEMGEQQ